MEKEYWSGIVGQTKLKGFFDSLIEKNVIPQAILIKGSGGNGKDALGVRLGLILNALSKGVDLNAVQNIHNPFSQPYIKFIFALPRGKNEASFDDPFEKLTKDVLDDVIEQLKFKNANPYYRLDIKGANEIKINSIRDIGRFLNVTFDTTAHRTVLISQADLMNEEAQNSLLKNLEEPPEKTTFILISDAPERLRETIVSRCWQLQTEPLDVPEISLILQQNFDVEQSQADVAASFAQGSVHTALELIQRELVSLKDFTVAFLRLAIGNRLDSAHRELQKMIKKDDTTSYILFLKLITIWLSDASRYMYKDENIYFKEFEEAFQNFHDRYKIESFDIYIKAIEKYIHYIENNNININIISTNLILLLASMTDKRNSK